MLTTSVHKIIFVLPFLLVLTTARAQHVTAKEEMEVMTTYPYSDPNPIPVLGINKKVAPFYPYFLFDGYTDKGVKKKWKVVKLENDFIEVTVLPEVGGKVMGAIEKATGNEFVYLNHVMKFRAIGIRGPWTSGGIEHNFGLDLGHAPWAASPVDYLIKNNEDGSVSCIVGGLDLASRTEWRMDIRLAKDKAYFETRGMWYNPGPLHHAHLSWENAAFKGTNDLQFYFPGNFHIGHDGLASPWPIDNSGRNLSLYKENNFGDSKSYHVVGDYRNWFGGYWHNKEAGFGHWAPYSDAPGKKLWIWSLAREGAIWEDLLTDADGQYIEAQSGVKLNQAGERSGAHSPFVQLSLRPLYAETKKEYWFPVGKIGGMVDATAHGTLNVTPQGDSLKVAVCPNENMQDSLVVRNGATIIYTTYLQLQPLQIFEKTIPLPAGSAQTIRVSVGGNKLLYASDKKENEVNRPVITTDNDYNNHSAQRYFRMAEDENAMRNYDQAFTYYKECLAIEPAHNEALSRVAEYYYRSGQYEQGISYARKVLEYNTYDGAANFIYGNLVQRTGKLTEAEEAFSMAAWTMEYRSAAYTALAGINMQKHHFDIAADNAGRALDYNRNNLLAYQYLITAYRKLSSPERADSIANVLLEIDPLNKYARFEQYFLHPVPEKLTAIRSVITNELPFETYLELAITYANEGMTDEAIRVLELSPAYPTVYYWLAYLKKDCCPDESQGYLRKAVAISPAFVFPFRLESIPVLTWAANTLPSWKTDYYLGLVYWNNLRRDQAAVLFEKCGDTPDFAPLYLVRSALFQRDSTKSAAIKKDLEHAVSLAPEEWRTWHYYGDYLQRASLSEQHLTVSEKAWRKFKTNPVIAMDYAKALLDMERPEDCLKVLANVLILPQEGAQEGHEIYELANISLALKMIEQGKYRQALTYLNKSREWPERLGTGKPYDPDNRVQDFIAAYCERKLNNQHNENDYYKQITNYSLSPESWNHPTNPANNYISALVLKKQGKETELRDLVTNWKEKQDSLSNWNIMEGSASPEFKWVMARYKNENDSATILEKELLSAGVGKRRFKMLIRALKDTSR
ncbi:DUF5107 domain-containing protein [Chitinophaga sp. MM2321]|uniref:DUF5107 domain-containing protein n=1 Tax=Chitinophaga sp. MM2321 TaxID=3137178 RepID=UPI0032D567FF